MKLRFTAEFAEANVIMREKPQYFLSERQVIDCAYFQVMPVLRHESTTGHTSSAPTAMRA